MHLAVLHPALRRLLRFQAVARWSLIARRIRTPRRLILTVMALVLAAVWIGQAVAGVLFRPAADPARLQVWIPLGLLSYGLWHVVKTACRKPIEPLEWTPTEQEILGAAPLTRQQLVTYRLASVVVSAFVKASLFALVMLPDLTCWTLGFIGMLLGLIFLDLVRITVEVAAWGLAPTTLRKVRTSIITIAAGCAISALIVALCEPARSTSLPAAFSLAARFLSALVALTATIPGRLALLPFQPFAALILAGGSAAWLLLQLGLATATVAGTAWSLIWLDDFVGARRAQRATAAFPQLRQQRENTSSKPAPASKDPIRVPRGLGGCGPICWRQAQGMVPYGPSILLSMALPGFLSLLPLLIDLNPLDTLVQVTGSLVFYSFLLMPAALRFDYRRDVDRIAVLKALPLSSQAITLGQLAAPLVACTLFQLAVLLVTMLCRPFHPAALIICLVLLVPINAVIFGLENLIFLLFPYRPNQEGVAVFIRSMLTFTAKGALFVVALLAVVSWIATSRFIVDHTSLATPLTRMVLVFSAGMWTATCGIATAIFLLLARVYDRFDPSQDTPAMS